MDDDQKKRFVVGLSFRGKNRQFVRNVAKRLVELIGEEKVYFDEYFQSELHGVGGDDKLRKIYREQCELLVPFFSAGYEENWCGVEWRTIKAVMLTHAKDDRVVPVHLDGTKIEGWEKNDIGITKKSKDTGQSIANRIYDICKQRCSSLSQIERPDLEVFDTPIAEPNTATDSSDALDASDTKNDTPQKANDIAPEHGFLIVVDVSDSSALPGRELRAVIQSLWQLPDELSPNKIGNGASASGILDGLIIAIPKARHAKILAACCEHIERIRTLHETQIRIAVHRGDYHRIETPSLIVGTAPNECSRLVRIAGPGQIVVSDQFIQSWTNDESLPAGAFFPDIKDPAWQVQQKPGTVSTLRLYRCPNQEHDLVAQARPPKPLQWIHQAEQGIESVLDEIEHLFGELVRELNVRLSPQQLKTRVSLFVPDSGSRFLVPTEFRFVRHNRDQALAKVGTTKYRIGTPQDSQGPLGQAFARNRVQAVADLPSFKIAPSDYIRSLEAQPWSMPGEAISKFSRKARAYLAIPFSLTDKSSPPEGAICIDTEHPLTGISQDLLIDIGEAIELNYRIVLGALWRLRL